MVDYFRRRPAAGVRARVSRFAAAAAAMIVAVLGGADAHATTVTEGTGLLDTYTGPRPADDLDALSATATYNSKTIFLSATMAAPIGTTDDGIYIWGVNRGAGTELLNGPTSLTDTSVRVGQGVPFDAFILLDNEGHGSVFLLGPADVDHPEDPVRLLGPPTALRAGAVTIDGATISVAVPRSLLPSQGFDVAGYGYNIWPRYEGIDANTRVTDFLPDASNFEGSATPEPAAWALMISGFGVAGAAFRRRRALAEDQAPA